MKNLKAQNIKVIKNKEKPETPEILAASIIEISQGFEKLLSSGLTRRGLVLLLFDLTKAQVSKKDIELVLDNLPKLASYYVRKK